MLITKNEASELQHSYYSGPYQTWDIEGVVNSDELVASLENLKEHTDSIDIRVDTVLGFFSLPSNEVIDKMCRWPGLFSVDYTVYVYLREEPRISVTLYVRAARPYTLDGGVVTVEAA